MLVHKPRVWLLGMLVMLLVGSFATASAEAAGPFWYHRCSSLCPGIKWSQQTEKPPWEEVRGGGGEAVLEGKLIAMPVTIVAKQVQVKGIVYNNALQGQAKLEFAYSQPAITKPAQLAGCPVIIGTRNVVKVFGHQAWTWDGTTSQLEKQKQQPEQKPDWIFIGQELQQGATGLPKGVPFTNITIGGVAGCTIAEKTPLQFTVEGSVAAAVKPEHTEEYSTSQTAEALGNGALQHFWNGEKNVGSETKLIFGGEAATLKQTDTVNTFGRQGGSPEELALLES